MGKESDWKKFNSMIVQVRESYLAEQNKKLAELLKGTTRTETERFWDTFKRIKEVSYILSDCLDDNSRSRMEIQIRRMLIVGMLSSEDLQCFSEELRAKLE